MTVMCRWPQVLASVADQVKNFAVIYLVDISEVCTLGTGCQGACHTCYVHSTAEPTNVSPLCRQVPDFNTMYELYDPCTIMFFFRNKVGTLFNACVPRATTLSADSDVCLRSTS